jgi:UDP-N-acetyl-2-amino-2-deoxyglucuronate dehydrogenase
MAGAVDRTGPLGIGVIGAGAIVQLHGLAYRSFPELARLVAVSDIDRGRAEAARAAHGFLEAYTDHREMLERNDIDVVSVCTRPNIHAQLVGDALEAGKHVLCEKPIAHTLRDADAIVAAAEKHPDLKVSILYQWRTDPSLLHLRKLIEQEQLGRCLMADLRANSDRPASYFKASTRRGSWELDGGGVLINIAIHQLDAYLWLLGNPVEVSAQMDTFMKNCEAEDSLAGLVRFESGALGTIRCTVCALDNDFTIDILAENGAVELRGGARGPHPSPSATTWKLRARTRAAQRAFRQIGFEKSPPLPRERPYLAVRAAEIASRLRGRSWLPPRHWWHAPFVRQFLEAVRTDAPAPVPPREGRRSLELTVALYESALMGKPVRLPLDHRSAVYSGVDTREIRVASGG